jgi:hypothetical protein
MWTLSTETQDILAKLEQRLRRNGEQDGAEIRVACVYGGPQFRP